MTHCKSVPHCTSQADAFLTGTYPEYAHPVLLLWCDMLRKGVTARYICARDVEFPHICKDDLREVAALQEDSGGGRFLQVIM